LEVKVNDLKGYYNSLPKEQLIIFLLNQNYEIKQLESRLEFLSGCCKFGHPEGTDGSCVDCYYDNKEQFAKCEEFAKRYNESKSR